MTDTIVHNKTSFAGGNPAISRSNDVISVDGDLNGAYEETMRRSWSFYQQAEYISDVPVGEGFNDDNTNSFSHSQLLDFNEEMETPPIIDLQNNIALTEVTNEEDDLTGFFFVHGFLASVTLNDTDGNPIGKIIGFQVSLTIFVYQTSSQEFLVIHSNEISGHGNILPNGLIDHLNVSMQKMVIVPVLEGSMEDIMQP